MEIEESSRESEVRREETDAEREREADCDEEEVGFIVVLVKLVVFIFWRVGMDG